MRRVILVGLMCAGKSAVGRLLANELGWRFIDFDEEIERSTGRSITEIFRFDGEAAFRRLEAGLTEALADQREVVLAPGGGWITQPDLVERLRPQSLLVWLRVSPRTAYERHLARGRPDRPLLEVDDPVAALESILERRRHHYDCADLALETDSAGPAEVTAAALEAIRALVDR